MYTDRGGSRVARSVVDFLTNQARGSAQSCSARLLLQGRLFRCSWHERQPAASHRSKRASEIVGGGEMARLVQAAAAPGMAPGDGVVARSWLGSGSLRQTGDMSRHLLLAGPAGEVPLQHFPGTFVRLLACPQGHEQRGNQGDIQLDGYAVGTVRQQMPTAQDVLEPAEE